MPTSDTAFTGSIPELYDSLLVPMIFQPYARDIAARVAALAPAAVLETAAGTGVVTRTLAPLLGKTARYVATDLNQPMLDRAIGQQPKGHPVEWTQADALALPFADASFDVVLCQFGVMFFPDRIAGYKEALRCLTPGGTFLFNAWDRIDTNEFANVATRAVAEFFPDDPPDFMARTPHGYNDTARIAADVRAAGFRSVAIHTVTLASTADTPHRAARAYCQGTPLRFEIEKRNASALTEVTDRATAALQARFGPGPITGSLQAHVVIAGA